MKKVSHLRYYCILGLLVTGANIAHPFTPMLIQQLGMPDYMYGLAYSMMSFSLFLFSPFWGKFSDKNGRVITLFISGVGYAVGQFLFSISTTIPILLLARFVSGFFVSAYMVGTLAYLSDITPLERRGKYMTYYAAVTSASVCLGFLIGGLIGSSSIPLGFAVQVVMLAASGILFYLTLREGKTKEERELTQVKQSSCNPFRIILQSRQVMTPPVLTYFLMVFVSSFGMQTFDNVFNFFLKAEFSFPPSYNGVIKAIIGVIGIVCNFTINLWLVKRFPQRKTMFTMFMLCTLSVVLVILMPTKVSFIGMSLFYFALNSTYMPVLQSLMGETGQGISNGVMSGLYNSAKSLGMITGPLFGGFIYSINSRLPFGMSAAAFLLATVFSFVSIRQFREKKAAE